MFYTQLLLAIRAPIFSEGDWKLCERSGWSDNSSFENLVAWSWVKGTDRRLIVVNLSEESAQAHVPLPWEDVRGATSVHLVDALSHATYDRAACEMLSPGLYVELAPWGYHFLKCDLMLP
jgi:hypothetical protein